MNMREYLRKYKKDRARLHQLAQAVGVCRVYLTQIASSHRRAGAALARRIHEETGGEIHMCELRPDIFPPDEFPGPRSLPPVITALDRAIEYFGSGLALARAIDPKLLPMSVTQWKNRGVPMKWAVKIERLTDGAVTLRELCPEAFVDPGQVA